MTKLNSQSYSISMRNILAGGLLLISCVAMFTAFRHRGPQRGSNDDSQIRVYKLRDDLILALIPLERELEPIDKAQLRAMFPNPQSPPNGTVSGRNSFFMPGATVPENPRLFYSDNMNERMGKPLDLNVVTGVRITPWTAEMYRLQPEAVRDARIGWKQNTSAALVAKYPIFEKDGMQCYVLFNNTTTVDIQDWNEGTCIAERAPGEWAHFEFGSGPSGYIRTEYFTHSYGGLSVSWNASYRNFSRWREIDAKLWQLIDARNLAKTP